MRKKIIFGKDILCYQKTFVTFNILLHCKIWNNPTFKYELIFSKSTACHTYVVSWQWLWIGGVGTRAQSWRGWLVHPNIFYDLFLDTCKICFCGIGACKIYKISLIPIKEISGNIVFTKIKLLLKNVLPYFINNVSCEKW